MRRCRMEQWITRCTNAAAVIFANTPASKPARANCGKPIRASTQTFALELARAGMKQNERGKWLWKFDPLHRTAAPQPFYTAQAREFFRRIACPVLIVDGKQSRQTRRTDKQARYDAHRDQHSSWSSITLATWCIRTIPAGWRKLSRHFSGYCKTAMTTQ